MKVAVLGYYGHNNFGDSFMLQGIRDLFPRWDLKVFTNDAGLEYPQFDANEVNKCDLFVLGGGEIIGANRLMVPCAEIDRIEIPKIALGVGVNVKDKSELSSDVLRSLGTFVYLGLRDNKSYKMLWGTFNLCNMFYDLGFGVRLVPPTLPKLPNSVLIAPTDRRTNKFDDGITLFNLARDRHFKKSFKNYLKKFDAKFFLPFGGDDNDDYQTCLDLARDLDNAIILKPSDLSIPMVSSFYQLCSYVVGFRLHSLILAKRYDVPFEAVDYHRKVNKNIETMSSLSVAEIVSRQYIEVKHILANIF